MNRYTLKITNTQTGKSMIEYEGYTSRKSAQQKAEAWNALEHIVAVVLDRKDKSQWKRA